MDSGARAVRVFSIEWVFGRQRITHGSIELGELVECGEIRRFGLEIPHADEVQQYPFQRSIAGSLALAETGAIDRAAAFAHRGKAIGHDQPGVVVGMEFQFFRRKSERPQLAKDQGHAAWKLYVVVGEPESHRVADAELWANARAGLFRGFHDGFDKR